MTSNTPDADKYKNLIQNLLSKLKTDYQYVFSLSLSDGFTVTSRSKSVESIEHHQDTGLAVAVYNNYKKGTASTNNLSLESIQKTIEKAEYISTNTQQDECQGLPESNYTKNDWTDLGIYYPEKLDINEIIDKTIECESEAFSFDNRITNSEGSTFSYSNQKNIILNSNGAYGSYKSTDYSLSCIALAEQDKLMERDYWYSSTRDLDSIENAKDIGRIAARRAVSRLGAKTIKTRVCPVLFSPEMAQSIISNFLGAIDGSSIYKKSSFLLNKLEETIFPNFLNIREEPLLERGPATRPYDIDGVLTCKKDIISKGILKTYLLDTYSSRKLKMECTGNGSLTNIIIDTDRSLTKNIISTMEDGIFITDMMGSGANTLTGDYSRGAFGYLIKDGEIKHPVTEITVASNLLKMFKNIVALGDDIDTRGRIRTGSILVKDITIGGTK